MLGQRLSNEQSNVGPTKYVAVGPTLNQRLGFGWRMVSVLAGMQCSDGHFKQFSYASVLSCADHTYLRKKCMGHLYYIVSFISVT